eukprot:1754402-Prymnesium_polylepis.1
MATVDGGRGTRVPALDVGHCCKWRGGIHPGGKAAVAAAGARLAAAAAKTGHVRLQPRPAQ